MASNEHPVWRSHGQEAQRGWTGGSASHGMGRRWGRCFSCGSPGVSLIARRYLSGATPRGQSWTSAGLLPHGRNGLNAQRMAVVSTFREPSLCRHVPRELWRSVWLDLPPIIAVTACHQRNCVERYSRFSIGWVFQQRTWQNPWVEVGLFTCIGGLGLLWCGDCHVANSTPYHRPRGATA